MMFGETIIAEVSELKARPSRVRFKACFHSLLVFHSQGNIRGVYNALFQIISFLSNNKNLEDKGRNYGLYTKGNAWARACKVGHTHL